MNLKKSLSTTFLGLIIIIVLFISCNIFDHVYDNQTDPEYDGAGKYSLSTDSTYFSLDTLSVLTDIDFTFEDKGLDDHWYSRVDITTEPVDTSVFRLSIDSNLSHIYKFSFFFADTFKGRLILKATRPNGLVDSSSKEIIVINPFTITGKQIAGIGDTVLMRIEPSNLLTIKNSHSGVLWSFDNEAPQERPFDNAFAISRDLFDTLLVEASLFRGNDTVHLKPITLTFNGHSPQIDSAKLLEPLRVGLAPRILIGYSDSDEGNTISFEITVNGSTVEGTFEPSNKPGTGVFTFSNTIIDITPKTITLRAVDNTGLISEPFTLDSIEVMSTPPEVKFINTDTLFLPPMNSPIYLATTVVKGEPVRYLWKLDGKELPTEHDYFLTLESRNDTTVTHTVTVQCFDRFDIPGPVATLRFRVAPYRYIVSPVPGSNLPATLKVNQQYTLKVQVMDTDQNILGNDSIIYSLSGLDTSNYSYTQIGPEIKITLKKELPSFMLTVNALIGEEQIAAAPLSIASSTSRFAPTCKFIKPLGKKQEIYLDSTVSFQVKAEDTNEGGSVEEIFYVLIQGTSKDTVSLGKKTSWSITFGKKGTSRVIVFAVDNEKNRSVPDTITFDVKSEKPQFTLDKVDTTMTIKDTMYIHASLDYNYGVTYVWDRDNDGIFEDTTGSKNSITLYYDTTGTYIIRAQCLSELGDTAISAMVFTITVTEGRPFVKSISVSDTTYPGKKFTINVSAYDNKGISEYLFSLDSGSFLSTETSSIDTFFTTIGKHFIHIKVKDNIGLFSDVLTDSIIVAHGEPSIQNFKASVTTTLVKEDVTFSFIPFDPDGEVKKVYFNWNGGTTVQDSLLISYKPDSTFTFIKKFTVAESGTRKVRIWAVDNENQKSLPPEEIEISVLKGDPVIKNVTPGEVWVKRDTMITIHASDTNGSIVMTWVDWNNDGKWDDSSDVAKVFPHKWDTLSGDKFSAFTIKVKDDDQLTATKVCSVFVKMGRPVVRGGENYGNTNIQWKNGNDGLDTMFFVWNAGQVTAVAVDTADPNGYCKEYYWNWYKLGLINNTTSVPYLTKEGLTINDTNRVTVTCIDNDSIYSKPYSFFVFPDAPPPEPVVYTGSRDGDSVTVKWVKSMDDKDKGNTKVQILIGYGITSEPSTALFSEPLPTVDSFELDPNDNTLIQYKFKADSNGAGRFKVKLIDARGSSATSTDRGSF